MDKTELIPNESENIKPGDAIAVRVRFVTEDVRLDDDGYLRDRME